jgi:ATP-dependent DNA helicase DinG
VREHLLERFGATILTSATLTVEGRFDYVRRRLGIRRAAEVRLSSEFDYAVQALLYLPRHMPSPKDAAFAEAAARECLEILRRSEGRAFVLFTSYAMLRAVEPVLNERLAYPLLVQGRAPRSALIETFRQTPNSVLLATSSFWQGVDVIGDALSCVIIDKLPFASPGDPIVQARVEAVARTGADPFATFQVPLAILTLLQGIGRLLRHRNDRGVLAILDPRLSSMGYGRRFLADLPPVPVTRDLDEVARFFGT